LFCIWTPPSHIAVPATAAVKSKVPPSKLESTTALVGPAAKLVSNANPGEFKFVEVMQVTPSSVSGIPSLSSSRSASSEIPSSSASGGTIISKGVPSPDSGVSGLSLLKVCPPNTSRATLVTVP